MTTVVASESTETQLFSALARPFQIRGINFRNRFVQAPLCAMYSAPDGSATPQNVEYYRARAAGGAALCIVEITFIDSGGSRAFHAQLGAHNDTMIPGLSDIAEAIRSQGAVAGLQLGHCGPQRVITEPPVVAASPIPWMAGKRVPAPLSADEIKCIVADHAAATRRAVQAGFDLLELHAAHGYLVNAFLTPATNRRTDDYGGNLDNRARFLLEIVGAMRAELGPKRILCVRLNGDDLLEGGLDTEQYCTIAGMLAQHGVDIIHVSAGTYRVMEKRIPPMYLASETFAGYAGPIRNASRLPVIASGTIHDMAEANRLIEDGEADFVGLARPLFADPDLPAKILGGREREVLPCIRCNTCVGREQSGKRAFCSINPRTGHEYRTSPRPMTSRKVGIIGAGPAGIEMALTAAARGHRVTLWEKQNQIGGLMRLAANLPFKHTLPRLLRYYENALASAGVDVRLGEEVTPADLDDEQIALAIGVPWDVPNVVARASDISVISAPDAIAGLDRLSGRILVVGAGLVGMEIAWAASERATVVLAERDADYDDDVNLHARLVVAVALAAANVDVRFNAEVMRVEGRAAFISADETPISEAFDTVIWTPRRSIPIPATATNSAVIAIGECGAARGLLESTTSGHRAALSL